MLRPKVVNEGGRKIHLRVSGLGSTYPKNHQELRDHFDVISITVLFFMASVNNGILDQRKI